MSEFRQRLRKEVVDPALSVSGRRLLVAVITSKGKNSYSIEFINEDGEKATQTGVKARQLSNSSITEYAENEKVFVEYENDDYTIVATYHEDTDVFRASMETKQDQYPNLQSNIWMS